MTSGLLIGALEGRGRHFTGARRLVGVGIRSSALDCLVFEMLLDLYMEPLSRRKQS